MSRTNITDFSESDLVSGAYLVSAKQVATTRTGKPYLKVRLQDRTGEIEARIWENAEAISHQFTLGDVAEARGTVESFQGSLQLRLDDLRRLPPDEVNPADFLPASRYDVEEMWTRLLAIVRDMRNPHIRDLLLEILTEPALEKRFKQAPAAKVIHHAWIGGLLEHVLSLCHLTKRVCPHYPHIDEDQVLFGCIMHDLGKIWELTYESAFGYSDEGKLVGHLVTGAILTDRAVQKRADFPEELAMRLKHILLAHHGTYEFGSPKLPQTLEAELVHRLDDLDSKITAISETLHRPDSSDSSWSEFNRSLGRSFFRGKEEPASWVEKMSPLPNEEEPKGGERPKTKGGKSKTPHSLDLFEGGRKSG